MKTITIYPTETAQWQALLNEAQVLNHCILDEEIESYLVFLLMRFTTRPEMASSILAMDFFDSLQHVGQHQREKLRDIGDKSLLFSGLFPGVAERRRINVNYFIDMGQTAYATLSIREESELNLLYNNLTEHFIEMTQVLQATRQVTDQPIDIDELFNF